MNTENTATLPGNRSGIDNNARNILGSSTNALAVKYARLQGYLEGYLDQMSASKDAQEELISKLLSELADILNPVTLNKNIDQ
jgi:hypothetical protein